MSIPSTPTANGFYDLEALKDALADAAESWVPAHFKAGIRQGVEWRLGNIQGQSSKTRGKIGSCAICLVGEQAGSFYDFATQEQGGPFQTLEHATGLSGKELFVYAANLTGQTANDRRGQGRSSYLRRDTSVPANKRSATQNRRDGDKRRLIEKIWLKCIPCGGNAGEAYLQGRGLEVPSTSDLLFHPNLKDYSNDQRYPALVAAIRDAQGELIGIHRTYLKRQNETWRVHSRKMLGQTKGGWVCLKEGSSGSFGPEVTIGEGIETVLSVAHARPQSALYACLSAGALKAAPVSANTKHLLILADKDANQVGQKAAEAAAAKLASEMAVDDWPATTIQIAMPDRVGEDFNDVLQRDGHQGIIRALNSAKPFTENNTEELKDIGKTESEEHAAVQFCEKYQDQLRYASYSASWYLWKTTRWERDETEGAYFLGRKFCRQLEGVGTWQRGKGSFISSVLRIARTTPELATKASDWNADPWKLGTPGGTIDLKTGTLSPPNQDDYISKQVTTAPTCIATQNKPPRIWLKFLKEATSNDPELVGYLQRICGYLLTGVTSEHALFFVYGSGGNGKSVFLNTVTYILGDYARTSAMETFTSTHGDRHPTELAMLEGARLVSVSETEEGRAWAESRIKQLTGGDKVSARFMRQDFFEYTPQFKLLIVGNHKPVLRNVDEAAKRRFNIIPFVHKPAVPDQSLEAKLKAEYPAILQWMIEGCLAWQRQGLAKPEAVAEATQAYFDDQDLVGAWLSESCDLGEHEWETSSKLYASWKAFAERNGEYPGSAKSFASKLSKRGFHGVRRTVNGATARCYEGISVRHFADPASEAHNR